MSHSYNRNRRNNKPKNNKRYLKPLEIEKIQVTRNLREEYNKHTQQIGDTRVSLMKLEAQALAISNQIAQNEEHLRQIFRENYPNCDIKDDFEVVELKESGL